ncbi:hypothetical protein [Mycobacterium sp. 3519A]|uniref:hypothetical protein n=1 Tax=Mycobacterium sp. 3519A TaxID=2057184 RepID=UPI0035185DF5
MPLNRKALAVANIATAGFITVGAVAFAATAAADPPPDPAPAPGDPAPPPPPGQTVPMMGGAPLGPEGLGVLTQTGQNANSDALGAPPVTGMDASTVLGQNPIPAPPGGSPGAVPNLNVFNNAYGVQQCLKPSAPGKCEEFGVDPGQENADVTRRQWLGRYIDMYRAGMLKGGLLGQVPQEQLGEPLPGTAPPPGTNIPPGLDQFQPDPPPPPDAPPPPVPPPPG